MRVGQRLIGSQTSSPACDIAIADLVCTGRTVPIFSKGVPSSTRGQARPTAPPGAGKADRWGTRAALKARAAARGQSLSEYLLSELTVIANRPTVAEMTQRISRLGESSLPAAARVLDEERR